MTLENIKKECENSSISRIEFYTNWYQDETNIELVRAFDNSGEKVTPSKLHDMAESLWEIAGFGNGGYSYKVSTNEVREANLNVDSYTTQEYNDESYDEDEDGDNEVNIVNWAD